MFRYISCISLFVFYISTSVTAATLIEIDNKKEGRSKVLISDGKVRVTSSKDPSYVLIDYTKQTMHVVMPEQKQIMNMSGDMPSMPGKPAAAIKMSISAMGNGPKIAGYATKKFAMKANGKNCGTVYGSVDALKDSGIEKFFSAMEKFQEKSRAAMGAYAEMMDPCDRAKMNMSSHVTVVGAPLRQLDNNGKIEHEVISIDTKASVPANAFNFPKGYKQTSMADQMKQAQTGNGMPKIDDAKMNTMMEQMKKMQQSGNLPPEAMEQMQRVKEMMMNQQK